MLSSRLRGNKKKYTVPVSNAWIAFISRTKVIDSSLLLFLCSVALRTEDKVDDDDDGRRGELRMLHWHLYFSY